MNTLVQYYRQSFPQDTKSDEEIIDLYAQSYPPEQLSQYPDFISDYQKIKLQRDVAGSSMWQEAKAGLSRGVMGLESAAAGIGAIGADVLGWQRGKDYLLNLYRSKEQQMMEEAPASVPTVQQALTSPSAFGQYVAGKAGELIPNVGEAVALAGAGSLVAPGPGTVAGAGNIFARSAGRAALNRLIGRTLKAEVRKEIEDYVAGTLGKRELSKAASRAMKDAAGLMASIPNFAALGAGGAYGGLSGREGVSDQAALEAAAIAGAGASIGALIPARILRTLFGDIGEKPARDLVDKYLVQVPKPAIEAGGAMSVMEFFNVLAEHHADPKLKGKPFSDEELSRIANAGVVGVIAGTPTAVYTGLRVRVGGAEKAKTEAEREEGPPPPPPPKADEPGTPPPPKAPDAKENPPSPGMTPSEVTTVYPANLTAEQRLVLRQIAEKEAKGEPLSDAERDHINNLPPVVKAEYETIKTEVSNAPEIRKRIVQRERERADAELQKAEEDRLKQAKLEEESAKASAGHRVPEEAGRVNVDDADSINAWWDKVSKAITDKDEDAAKVLISQLPTVDPGKVPKYSGTLWSLTSPSRIGSTFIDELPTSDGTPLNQWRGKLQQARDSAAKEAGMVEPTPAAAPPAEAAADVRARGMALRETPKKLTKKEQAEISEEMGEALSEEKVSPPSETTWVASVPEHPLAWREYLSESGFFHGISSKDKQWNTNRLGIFQTPDGKIAVTSLYHSGKKDRTWLGGEAKTYRDALKEGYKPIAYSDTGENYQGKVYRVYTKEEWAPVEAQLRAKAKAGTPVEEPPAVPLGAAVQETGIGVAPHIPSSGAPKPKGLSIQLARTLHGLMREQVHAEAGVEGKSWSEIVARAISRNTDFWNKIFTDTAGADAVKFRDIEKQIADIYERAYKSGEKVTPESLAGITPGEARSEAAKPPTEHLVGVDDVLPDHDRSDRFQAGVRAILEEHHEGSAYNALRDLVSGGYFKGNAVAQEIAAELVKLGDKGVKLLAGGRYFSKRLGTEAAGQYDYITDTVKVYDTAFEKRMGARGFLHEYAHGMTHDAIESGRFNQELSQLMGHAMVKAGREGVSFYGLSTARLENRPVQNLHEFMAEAVTNKRFQEFLNRTRSPLNEPQSLWQKFVDLVGRMLGIKNRSALADVLRLFGQIASERPTVEQPPVRVPEAVRTMRYHEPASGSEHYETYNPVTGSLTREPLVQDSPEAALHNIGRESLEFLLPAGAAFPTRDPAIEATNQFAINNKVWEVIKRAADAAGIEWDRLRVMFGLRSPQKVHETISYKVATENMINANPNQTVEETKWETNRAEVLIGSLAALEKDKAKIDKVRVKAKEDLETVTAQHAVAVERYQETSHNFEDASLLSKDINRDVLTLIRSDIRAASRSGQNVGAIMQIWQQLENRIGQPIDRATTNLFQRLADSETMQGEQLFDILEQMARDPSLDFSRPAVEIRNYIRTASGFDPTTSDLYTRLSQDTPLLSTAIAYGKLRNRMMTLLEARRAAPADRVALKEQLKAQMKESYEELSSGVKQVARSATLAERAAAANRAELHQIAKLAKEKERLAAVIDAGEKAIPHFNSEISKLVPKIVQTEDSQFGDGMVIRYPKNPGEMKPEWGELTLNLKATGKPTTTGELASTFQKMVAWTKMREEAATQGDELALDLDYNRVKQQVNEIGRTKIYDPLLKKTDQTMTGLYMGSNIRAIGSLGTPVSKLIESKLNQFQGGATNLRTAADKEFGYKNQRLFKRVQDVLNEGQQWYQRKKVKSDWFIDNIWNSAVGFWEAGRPGEWEDYAAAKNAWFEKMGQWFLSMDTVRPLIEDRMPEFMKSLRELLDSVYQSSQWWVKKNQEAGFLVEEPRLGAKMLRRHVEQGFGTFMRKFSKSFAGMVHAMRGAKWEKDDQTGEPGAAEAFSHYSELKTGPTPEKADALVAKYCNDPLYGDTFQNKFLYKLCHVPGEPEIHTPAIDDAGTTMRVTAESLARAYDETGGNVVAMLEKLYSDYNGQEATADYVQRELVRLGKIFNQVNSALNEVEPRDPGKFQSFVGMVPNAMINAREFQHLPPDWFTYHRFDTNDNARMAERVAWQMAMGRDGRTLANLHATAMAENAELVTKLTTALQEAKDATPSGRQKDIDRKAAEILLKDSDPLLKDFKTGRERLDFLRKQEERGRFIPRLLQGMGDYFHRDNQEAGSLRWGIRMAQELASTLVNKPAAAIMQMATDVDIMVQWGLSPTTVKAAKRAYQMTGKDIAGSLAQGIGWEFMKLSPYEERGYQLGFFGSIVARRMGDIWATLTGEENSPWARRWRIAKEAQTFTLNRLGEQAKYTPFQPAAPFFQIVTSCNRGLFVSLAEMADRYVTLGMDYLRTHQGAEKIGADELGLKGSERDTFELWQRDHARFGLDFTDMVKEGMQRRDAGETTVLTDTTLERINSVGLSVISLESNISTMPLWAFNNKIVRFGLPLLGWSYRRALQVPGVTLNANDERNLRGIRAGMLGLAGAGLGGLGLSLVVDAYSEDVLGKKRNIRGLRIPFTANDWMGIQERLNRAGIFGLWGEMVNSALNQGTGQGDNRLLSLDQRVVALQSFQSVTKAISALVNQRFDPDYQHVVRPMIGALGGGGLLEYMQIMNHAFDFDNVESRTVKRMNAQNYLRVTGRDLGMSLRQGGGAYNTPTPITPWIARMEYAAYANNPEDFRAAYRGALEEAKNLPSKPDPASYVKEHFSQRHPIRFVFAQVPSEREYRQILANLSDDGKEDVTEAVRLFNYYGSHLGIAPFQGSVKKDQQRFAMPPSARARAAALAY